jgi:gas vesicle protein
VCEFLGITGEDLADPELLFTDRYGMAIQSYEARTKDRWKAEYQEAHKDDDAGYLSYLHEAFAGSAVENGQEQSDEVQTHVRKLADQQQEEKRKAQEYIETTGKDLPLSQKWAAYDKANDIGKQLDALCLKRDSLYSGVAVPFDKFLETVLGYEGENAPIQERVLSAVSSVVYELMHDYFFTDPEVPIREIVLGDKQIKQFTGNLGMVQRRMAREYANRRWEAIRHLFYAGSYEEHSLFSGVHAD